MNANMARMGSIPAGWNARQESDRVLAGLKNICQPQVKGAHDSDFLFHGGKAYVVYMANDVQPGEHPEWPFVYNAISVVDPASGNVEATTIIAASEMIYGNDSLPVGACFVPRLLQKDEKTLRCFFISEDPQHRQSQVYHVDYDIPGRKLIPVLNKTMLRTDLGLFPMQPQYFHQHGVAKGLAHKPVQHGLYMVDGIRRFDGQLYAELNNFAGGQLGLATLNAELDCFTVVGDFFLPNENWLSESAVNRLPDGSWLAISRQDSGSQNYMFARSQDGRQWTAHEYWPLVRGGTNSKPNLERFGGVYYLGWQDAAKANGVFRSVFNIEVSRDGVNWERKYRFETEKSFQYAVFREYNGAIYLAVTQGDYAADRKERIMFGKLENI